jgi:hypothetical protein
MATIKNNVDNGTKKLQEIEDDLKLKLTHDIWQNCEAEYKEHISNNESQVCNVINKISCWGLSMHFRVCLS